MVKEKDNEYSRKAKMGSFRELADLIGVARSTISKAVATGRIKTSILTEYNPPKVILADAIIEWYAKTQKSKSRADFFSLGRPLTSLPSVRESEQVKAFFDAKEANRKDDEKEKQLVRLDEASKDIAECIKLTKDRLHSSGIPIVESIRKAESLGEAVRSYNKGIENAANALCHENMKFLGGYERN